MMMIMMMMLLLFPACFLNYRYQDKTKNYAGDGSQWSFCENTLGRRTCEKIATKHDVDESLIQFYDKSGIDFFRR